MDSLMLLGLPGRQLYCLMPTDQYFVFQHYFIRRRSVYALHSAAGQLAVYL